jgi:hypothetical protein
MTCDRCGVPLTIGDWPFCPHGRGTYAAVADDIPGGLTLHNLGPEPVTVYSHTQRRRLMRDRGLRECVRDVPGASWNAVCETTLENARLLLDPVRRRVPDAGYRGESVADTAEVETLTLTVRERADGFRVPPDGEPYA